MGTNETSARHAWVKYVLWAVGIVAGLLVFWEVLPALGIGDYWQSGTIRAFHGGAPAWTIVMLLVGIVVVWLVAFIVITDTRPDNSDRYSYDYDRRSDEAKAAAASKAAQARKTTIVASAVAGTITVVLVISLVSAIRWANRSEFDAVKTYSKNLTVVNGDRPNFDQRVTIATAKVLLPQSLTAGGTLDENSIANVGNDVCALVTRETKWYQGTYTAGVVCLSNADATKRTYAEFPNGLPHSDGTMGKNLSAFVTQNYGIGLAVDAQDVYGYIASGKAFMVVPTTRKVGISAPHDVPAGDIVFDSEGHSTMHTDVKAGEIPGPVFPVSIAAQVRDSVNTLDGFVKYDNPSRNPNALQDTSGKGSANTPDPNAGNNTEFVLRSNGRLYYVTLLTSYGSSSAVTATLVVAADELHANQAPKAVLYRHGAQSGVRDVAQRITSLYSNLQWSQSNDAAATDGNLRRIFEVTPAGSGEFRATIGTGGQVQFTAIVDVATGAGDKVGEICVYSAKTGAKVQCDSPSTDVTTLNVGDTQTPSTNPSGNPTKVTGSFDVTGLTTDQIVKLINDASAELARRSQK